MIIEIDKGSGFCFGVKRAINKAGELLNEGENLYCLGDIVHNHEEVNRLSNLGMKTVNKDKGTELENKTVLIRSHGEPPSTYKTLKKHNNKIIDATCPVVLKLQERINNSHKRIGQEGGQTVIFGKPEHPEVIGLSGQTHNEAIVVTTPDDLQKIDFEKPIELYSQTTMPLDKFHEIRDEIKARANSMFISHDTICRQVANRVPQLAAFSKKHDIILFVSGKKSSNGKLLYSVCRENNPLTYFISSPEEIDPQWLKKGKTLGICGATSTPQWLMQNVEKQVKFLLKKEDRQPR
ncbi:MAG: 4-hydroxy-3-methylbut-2-enyl diphosphate reductase [Prolixibacteraceae bacterium]|nr:4-hydroxy-3-methylbut-2-enyl diphosphate reductase [Prolixibacteraceae bacterium]